MNRILLNLLSEFKSPEHKIFIESGSLTGASINSALVIKHFEKIYSIELSEKYFNFCKEKFKTFKNVNVIFGDSGVVIEKILDTISSPCVFWLDGHYSAGDTAMAEDYCSPIVKELEHIKNHSIKNHIIIIDDIRVFSQYWIDENIRVNKKCGYVLKEELENKILEINKDYQIIYRGDQLVAKI